MWPPFAPHFQNKTERYTRQIWGCPPVAPPSGMKEQTLADYDANEARGFDQNMTNNLLMNEQAKQGAAALLTGQEHISNPVGYTSAAMQGNQSIMNAPLQTPGMGGLLGGIASGVISKLPTF